MPEEVDRWVSTSFSDTAIQLICVKIQFLRTLQFGDMLPFKKCFCYGGRPPLVKYDLYWN